MLIRDLRDRPEFTAGDGTVLRELLNGATEDLGLRYSLAHARLGAGGVSRRHRIEASEVYYILRGRGVLHVDGEAKPVEAGQAAVIPAGSVQHLENPGPGEIEFLCIVDPGWRPEVEEVL